MPEFNHPYISYLESLRDNDNRNALSALQRGLGQPIAEVPAMYQYIEPWLTEKRSPTKEARYYLIAALFAMHPQSGGTGNLGNSFARTRNPESDNTAIERRFTTLLTAHQDDLPFYLRQAVSYLKAKEIPINYHQLFYDLHNWANEQKAGTVQKQWAQSFWGRAQKEDDENTQELQSETQGEAFRETQWYAHPT